MALALYYGEALGHYGFGGGHPFGTDRLDLSGRTASLRNLAGKK